MSTLANLVRMTTATTGTGTITLGSAVTGFKAFPSSLDGKTVTYAIKDGANSEIGRGVYTHSGTTLTRSVLASTNADAALNLSGTAEVFITPAAEDIGGPGGPVRETLTANRTYYVRADGSDSNNGLANTSGGAFLTLQKAINVVAALDISAYNVTIQVADGTYTGSVVVSGPWVGSGVVTIVGNTTTPANVIISTSGATFHALNNATITLSGMEIRSTSHIGLWASYGAVITLGPALRLGACPSVYHMFAEFGGTIFGRSNYSIVGNAVHHWVTVTLGGISIVGVTITISGTPTMTAFAAVSGGAIECFSNTYSGSISGAQYSVSNGGVLRNGGATLPGSGTSGGTTTGGGFVA